MGRKQAMGTDMGLRNKHLTPARIDVDGRAGHRHEGHLG
jgi:hypothetical protein